jgi:hypothetical protein
VLLTVITRPETASPRRTRTESTRSGNVGKNKISLAGTRMPSFLARRLTSASVSRASLAEDPATARCSEVSPGVVRISSR